MNRLKTLLFYCQIYFYKLVANPINHYLESRRHRLWWKDRCTHCAGEGGADIGDYGDSCIEVCCACGGSGKKSDMR